MEKDNTSSTNGGGRVHIILGFVVFLLLLQVILSTFLINRVNSIDSTVSQLKDENRSLQAALNPNNELDLPSYVENVSIDDDPSIGTQGAPITIVEFADYQCPYCSQMVSQVEDLLSDYEGQILFVYRDFPLEDIHADAFKAAEAANCANDQDKYWEMHNLLFANQAKLDIESVRDYAASLGLNLENFDACLSSDKYVEEIRNDISDGLSYQVRGTPTYFVNGYRVPGASIELLTNAIENALDREG